MIVRRIGMFFGGIWRIFCVIGELFTSNIDRRSLFDINTDLVIQLGKIAVTHLFSRDCMKIGHWHSGFGCQVSVVKKREPA
jgi:hypothetical protein